MILNLTTEMNITPDYDHNWAPIAWYNPHLHDSPLVIPREVAEVIFSVPRRGLFEFVFDLDTNQLVEVKFNGKFKGVLWSA